MPLSFSPAGSMVSIKAIKGKDESKRFLESLGFVVGGSVTVIPGTTASGKEKRI